MTLNKNYTPSLKRFLFPAFLLFLFSFSIQAQTGCPAVVAAGAATVCPGNCTTLSATVQATLGTTSYNVNAIPYTPFSYTAGTAVIVGQDDIFSGVISIPFNFCFFGQTYNQCVIGANGDLTFDLTQANAYDPWSQSSGVAPNSAYPTNIMCPYHDIDPALGGSITWALYGTAPCRQLVISYNQVPMFSCTTEIATQQLVLNETTNYIDMYIENKPLCSTWNNGAAILGIQNTTYTTAVTVPGRNGTQWSASNEGWRFSPAGAPSYTLNWFNGATNIGSTPTVSVCPTTTTTYTAQLVNTNCDGTKVTLNSTVTVTVGGTAVGLTPAATTICPGGHVVLTATGATTYSWSPATGLSGTTGATVTASPTTNTTYTVTGTSGGCTGTATATVTMGAGPTLTPSQTNVTCNGASTGTASVAATGGTTPYTYSWSPGGATTSNVTGLAAGVYTVTVTSASGCSTNSVITITQPTAFSATSTQTNILCNGACTGASTVTPTGGTAAYTYAWAPSGGTTATASALCAGTYTCTITDSHGCTTKPTVTITQPAGMTLTTSFTGATCGQSDGSATVTATGGAGAYTYSWNPGGATTATLSNIPVGTYSVTVKDAGGCPQTVVVNVNNTGGPTASITSSTNVSCNGGSNGAATVTVTGGSAPFTYSWSPTGGTAATATGLAAGTYQVTINDNNGCQTITSVIITQPPAMAVTTAGVNLVCAGACNGSASVTPSGGSTPYTYSWSPSGGAGATANALCAGTYTCTITDAGNCSVTPTVTLTEPPAMTLALAGIASTCNGNCTGQLICIPSGGTTPYTFSWSTGCTAPSCNNVCAGAYNITVTDAGGCTATGNTTITEPAPLLAPLFATNAHCGLPDGKDSASVSGGTAPYSYSWTPGSGSATGVYTNLPPGLYTVTVTDSKNCTVQDTSTVHNQAGVTVTVSASSNVTCFNGRNGWATIGCTGGTAPYIYSWSPITGNTDSASGLPAGTYTCNVTDVNGCAGQGTATITQPNLLVATTVIPATICISQSSALTANSTGGTPAYMYSWTVAGTGVTPPVSPVVTTTYTVIATDANNCVSAPATVTLHVNPPLQLDPITNASICPGANAVLTAGAVGGNGNYSYNWTPTAGLSSSTVSNPTANPAATTTYTVIVSDNCGTPADTGTVTVTIYAPPVILFQSPDTAGCTPFCTSFVAVSTPACQNAVWQFGDGKTGIGCGTINHCYDSAGIYNVTLTVTDINTCVSTLTRPNYIIAYPIPHAAFTADPSSVSIVSPTINFTNGSTGANTWNWNFGDFSGASSTLQNPQYTYPDTGCYNVLLLVKNTFGCMDSVTSPVCIVPDFTFYAPNSFTPNGDGLNDVFVPKGIGVKSEFYTLDIFDRWGNLLFHSETWDRGWDGKANFGADVAQIDTYVWRVALTDYQNVKHVYTGMVNLLK